MKLLIIDDDPVVRHILSTILKGYSKQFCPPEEEPVEVTALTSGTEGVAFFTDESVFPAVIFLDLQLLDMTGFEVQEALEKKFAKKLPPIISMSAQPSDEIKKLNPSFDSAHFLQKPFLPEQVIEVLKSLTPLAK